MNYAFSYGRLSANEKVSFVCFCSSKQTKDRVVPEFHPGTTEQEKGVFRGNSGERRPSRQRTETRK